MVSIYDATAAGPVVVLMGENRVHAIGDTAYIFRRQRPGMTLPRFARGVPVFWCDDGWQDSPTGKSIIRNWSDPVTVVGRLAPDQAMDGKRAVLLADTAMAKCGYR